MPIRVTVSTTPLAAVRTRALVVPQDEATGLSPALADLDSRLGSTLARLAGEGTLKGKGESIELVHTLGQLPAERLLVAGVGKPAENDLRKVGEWACRVARRLRKAGVAEAAVALPAVPGADPARVARAAVE